MKKHQRLVKEACKVKWRSNRWMKS